MKQLDHDIYLANESTPVTTSMHAVHYAMRSHPTEKGVLWTAWHSSEDAQAYCDSLEANAPVNKSIKLRTAQNASEVRNTLASVAQDCEIIEHQGPSGAYKVQTRKGKPPKWKTGVKTRWEGMTLLEAMETMLRAGQIAGNLDIEGDQYTNAAKAWDTCVDFCSVIVNILEKTHANGYSARVSDKNLIQYLSKLMGELPSTLWKESQSIISALEQRIDEINAENKKKMDDKATYELNQRKNKKKKKKKDE